MQPVSKKDSAPFQRRWNTSIGSSIPWRRAGN